MRDFQNAIPSLCATASTVPRCLVWLCTCVCLCVCWTLCVYVWSVPTVKMPRMLVTSAYALQQLLKKKNLIGSSAAQVRAYTDHWHCTILICGIPRV